MGQQPAKMKLYVNFDVNAICTKALEHQLNDLDIDFRMVRMGEVEILEDLSLDTQENLQDSLERAGIFVVNDDQFKLVHRIKETISEMIEDESAHRYNTSTYLSEKLNYSYNHLFHVFSQATLGSIENFVILQKIDYAKTLLIKGKLTLSEIAYKLNYSSSAHLSSQFKRTTGLTPTNFQHLIKKRKERRHNSV